MNLKALWLSLLMMLAPAVAEAQSTAQPVVPGYLSTAGCPGGQTPCFIQFGSGGGGGTGGPVTAPLGPATAPSAAVAITDTGTPITGQTIGAGGQGLTGWLSQIYSAVNSSIPAGTNNIGQTSGAINQTLTDCSGTIIAGGTAQNAFTAQTTLHGFTIANIDATSGSGEVLNISFTGTAAAATAGSYPLAAPTATTLANLSSFTSPPGMGTNHALSVIAATTGHKFSCTWW